MEESIDYETAAEALDEMAYILSTDPGIILCKLTGDIISEEDAGHIRDLLCR